MIRTSIIVIGFVFTLAVGTVYGVEGTGADVADEWGLLPCPRQILLNSSKTIQVSEITHIVCKGCEMPILYDKLDCLRRTVCGGIGVSLVIDSISAPSSSEGYRLDVTTNGISILSRGEAGLFYGCITLNQLLTTATEQGKPLPEMSITDYPDITYRAIHIDTKHHLDRMEYYYRLVDRLAGWKVNAVIWEIEDKLRYDSHPECSAPNAISSQEMQALCRYAHERHIDISPLVQGLGHAGFILKHHPELRENPDSDWEFCPVNSDYYSLQFDLYRDAIEAMPYGKYLHIGGDEISGIGSCEQCRKSGLSAFQLQMQWLKKVCEWIQTANRRPICWDDMPLKYGGVWRIMYGGLNDEQVEQQFNTTLLDQSVGLFPQDCIYMRWHYDNPTTLAQRKTLGWYASKNMHVMGATAAADGGSPFMPRYNSKAQHIGDFCRLVASNHLEGILATSWDDGSPHIETVSRGYAALGEWAWNSHGRNVETFKRIYALNFWGFMNGEERLIDLLEESAFFFDGALVVNGRRNPSWQVREHTLLPLPSAEDLSGAWSKKWNIRIEEAQRELGRYEEIKQLLETALCTALRNRYALRIYEQLNQQFAYPARLLLAMSRYDKEHSHASREALLSVANDLQRLQDSLVATYSETRFMSQPAGYIQDQNNHRHLSALTLGPQWIFLYEWEMVDKIRVALDLSKQ